MKVKLLAVLCLAAVAGLAGCGGDEKPKNANANANIANNSTVTAPTIAPPVRDANVETAVKDALTKKGYADVTVEATANDITLRGTVPADKMTEVVRIAQETGKRPVKNQLTEKK